ncbi:MAG: hypothetical protein M1118_05675 [Chloroflexi bacterium]|nr:hypothetical protein [Chloroflexota bacterium]
MSHEPIVDHGNVEEEEEHIHLPGSSVWPFALAVSLFVVMVGLLFFPHWGTTAGVVQLVLLLVLSIVGVAGMVVSIISWGLQISEARPGSGTH